MSVWRYYLAGTLSIVTAAIVMFMVTVAFGLISDPNTAEVFLGVFILLLVPAIIIQGYEEVKEILNKKERN